LGDRGASGAKGLGFDRQNHPLSNHKQAQKRGPYNKSFQTLNGLLPIDTPANTMVDLTQHPVKGIYGLGALGFELLRFPIFVIKYLAFGRQHPSWTFRQAITVHAVFSGLWHLATLQVSTPLPLTPDREKERFVVIKPARDDAYKGPLRSNKDVVPVEIGATWYPAPLSAGSDKKTVKVILHVHGGAFVTG
jgi:hypothetical protein